MSTHAFPPHHVPHALVGHFTVVFAEVQLRFLRFLGQFLVADRALVLYLSEYPPTPLAIVNIDSVTITVANNTTIIVRN